jgi:hypothetical protein
MSKQVSDALAGALATAHGTMGARSQAAPDGGEVR